MVTATTGAAGTGSYAGLPDDDQHWQLTTVEGWRRYVDSVAVVPELLEPQAWKRLDGDQQFAYDEARLAHHARLLVVATSTIRKVITEGRRLSS